MQGNGQTKPVNTETVNYTYSADGAKHRMRVKTIYQDNTVVNEEKIYRGAMVMNRYWTETVSVPVTPPALAVEYILHPEGRTRFQTNGTPIYEYHLKDHLGNVRVAFEIDADGRAAAFQWNDYDPFGMVQENDYTFNATGATDGQLYKYNGKEEQNFGLNAWLDYGARMYNPALGRWMSIDPLAEKQWDYSPYNYCLNNPINRVDPDGRFSGDVGEKQKVTTDGNQYISLFNENAYDLIKRRGREERAKVQQARQKEEASARGAAAIQNAEKQLKSMNSGSSTVKVDDGGGTTNSEGSTSGTGKFGGGNIAGGGKGDGNNTKDGSSGKDGDWDLNKDGVFQKSEADEWWINGKGDVTVDNSKINWSGLKIPEGLAVGDQFSINTSEAFITLPFETASTYGGTSFEITGASEVKVLDQVYHYRYRPNNSVENTIRNFMNWFGKPLRDGTDYTIHYINPYIVIK